jgi:hypothetical protein
MSDLGSVAGSLIGMGSWSVESTEEQAVTFDLNLPGGPAVAQASMSHFNNTTGASAWVFEANGVDYFDRAVYLEDMTHVTFAVVSGFKAGQFGDDFCSALLNIFRFDAGASVVETPPPPPPPQNGGDW